MSKLAGRSRIVHRFRAQRPRDRDAVDRLHRLIEIHAWLTRKPGSPGIQPKRFEPSAPKLQPSTFAYRAYHAGFITARQARRLGCVLQNAGTGSKRAALNRQLRKRAKRAA